MSIASFSNHLQMLLDHRYSGDPSDCENAVTDDTIKAFVNGTAIRDHLIDVARRVADNIRDKRPTSLEFGKSVVLYEDENDGRARSLYLQGGYQSPGYYLASPDRYIIIALSDMVINHFRIAGPGSQLAYASPNEALTLAPHGQVLLKRGDALVRGDPADVFVSASVNGDKSLLYSDRALRSGHDIAFSSSTLSFLGTSLSDIASTKSISILEILEEIRSDFLSEAATDYISHPSPIVRWRALSSLNKIAHPSVTATLERFCDDETPFIAQAARRILAQGKVR
jgi:hypothetical protein